MTKKLVAVLSCAFAFSVLYAQGSNPMREGRWEITMQMSMPGMPQGMPAMKNTQCVTKAQLQDPANGGLPSASPDRNNDCKVLDHKIEGNKVSWKMACKEMTGSGELTYAGDTYDGLMKLMTQQGEMTMKMNGKRLGDCAP